MLPVPSRWKTRYCMAFARARLRAGQRGYGFKIRITPWRAAARRLRLQATVLKLPALGGVSVDRQLVLRLRLQAIV